MFTATLGGGFGPVPEMRAAFPACGGRHRPCALTFTRRPCCHTGIWWQMHMDSISTAWVCGLRVRTTPPNLHRRKDALYAVPDAQYAVELAGCPSPNPGISARRPLLCRNRSGWGSFLLPTGLFSWGGWNRAPFPPSCSCPLSGAAIGRSKHPAVSGGSRQRVRIQFPRFVLQIFGQGRPDGKC